MRSWLNLTLSHLESTIMLENDEEKIIKNNVAEEKEKKEL
jgi:hypothetical protein